jgi:hypothetical protein
MVNLFGNKDALIGSIELLIGALFVLCALVFRKSVANDSMGMDFSFLGSAVPAILGFIIFNNIFSAMKFPMLIAVGLFFAGGFLVGDKLGDGQAQA